ncbi:MAG: STAS domain-containing protein [Phycisphaerales bacterium]|nr:STAS domain-containing protein [Phycisphaerales bacterium]
MEPLKIEFEERDRVSILKLDGYLQGNDELSEKIDGLLEKENCRIVLELSQVHLINSAGLGELVRLAAQANSQGGRLVFANPTPFVEGVLKTTRLDRFFEVHETLETALRTLA